MNKIKLLKFVNVFEIGGTEKQFVTLGNALDSSRFELHFACFRRGGGFLGEIEALQVPVTEYRIQRLYDRQTFQQQLAFAKDMKSRQIQIIHSYSFYAHVFAIPFARLGGVPVIAASIRDMGPYLTPMKKRVQKWVCGLADSIVANSDAVRQWLISQGYDPAKITVIRNGVDLTKFAGKRDGRLRQELGIAPDSPLVAVLSRLNEVKGIDYFLEAAALVARRFDNARFLVIGDAHNEYDCAYRRDLERYAAWLGIGDRVIFTGFRLDVPEVLSEVAVSVLPSHSEGLPNAALESMAAGVPVTATNVGGSPEAVVDGVTGFLVPPRDPAALAEAICRLLGNRQMALSFGEAGRRRVEEHFSIKRMVRETEELYLRLLEKRGRERFRYG